MNTHNRDKQLELWANLNYVSFFSSIVHSGKLKKIKGSGLSVLLVLKTLCEWNSNRTTVGQRKISYLTGLSADGVKNAVDILEEEGLIRTHRKTPKSITTYEIMEVVQAKREELPVMDLVVPYRQGEISRVRQELQEALEKTNKGLPVGGSVKVVLYNDNRSYTINSIENQYNNSSIGEIKKISFRDKQILEAFIRILTEEGKKE